MKRRKAKRRALQMELGIPTPAGNQVIINAPAYTDVPSGASIPTWLGTYVGEIAQTLTGTWRWTGADWFQLLYGGG